MLYHIQKKVVRWLCSLQVIILVISLPLDQKELFFRLKFYGSRRNGHQYQSSPPRHRPLPGSCTCLLPILALPFLPHNRILKVRNSRPMFPTAGDKFSLHHHIFYSLTLSSSTSSPSQNAHSPLFFCPPEIVLPTYGGQPSSACKRTLC